MNILLDTGFLVALIVKPQSSKQIEQHETAKQMLKTHSLDNFHTVWECITEACHLLSKDSRQILLKWLIEFGVFVRPGLSGAVCYRRDSLAVKTPG